jgi:hypothetical protein
MPYAWNGLSFDVPSGLVDQTVVSFVDNPAAPNFTVTLSKDTRGGTAFGAYVKSQLGELMGSLSGYVAIGETEQVVGGRPAVVVEHRARTPQGITVRQRQAYVDMADAVVILAVTWPDKPNARATEAFDTLLNSIRASAA